MALPRPRASPLPQYFSICRARPRPADSPWEPRGGSTQAQNAGWRRSLGPGVPHRALQGSGHAHQPATGSTRPFGFKHGVSFLTSASSCVRKQRAFPFLYVVGGLGFPNPPRLGESGNCSCLVQETGKTNPPTATRGGNVGRRIRARGNQDKRQCLQFRAKFGRFPPPLIMIKRESSFQGNSPGV